MSPRFADRTIACLVALSLACGACRKDAPTPASVTSPPDAAPRASAGADPSASAAVSKDAVPREGGPLAFPDAIRLGRWRDAEDAIARLPEPERARPQVRLARARVALMSGRHADALALLEKLEDELPLLRDLVAKTRAESALGAGQYEKAGEWLAARTDAASAMRAAEAWDKHGDATKARAACDRVLADPKRGRSLEERARSMRMRIVRLKDGDPAAADDARWLAIHGLRDADASAAADLLRGLTPARALSSDELLERARYLTDVMRTDDALRTVERAALAKGRATPNDLCRARADALYRARTRYPEAALAYRQCAAMGGAHAAEDMFLTARAFSRADRDADAIPAFQAVIQRHPRTTWADQAEFHIARTHSLAGKWHDAAVAFDEYVRHNPAGRERREADRYRAIAHLLAHDNKIARKLLEDLAANAEDNVAQARWMNLAALAALHDGERLWAIGRWSEVARARPLTWPALVARARLTANGAPLPVTIEPAPSGAAAEQLAIELPPPADMLHTIGFDAEAEEALREREGIVTGKAQGRGTEALCAAYAMIDRGKRRYQISQQIPGQLLATAPGPRNRWAWDCVLPRPYKPNVRVHETETKLPLDLVWSVMRQESGFDAEVVSPARAVGLMQLLPETAKTVASKAGMAHDDAMLVVPEQNIALGALYLRELLNDLDGNVVLAVGAYNAGPEAIKRWLGKAKTESIDVFVEAIPFVETRGYVVRVLGNLARYGFLEREEAGVPTVALDLK